MRAGQRIGAGRGRPLEHGANQPSEALAEAAAALVVLGDRDDGHAAALGRLYHQLLIDEVDAQLLRDGLSDLARAAGEVARHRDNGHIVLSLLTPKKRL